MILMTLVNKNKNKFISSIAFGPWPSKILPHFADYNAWIPTKSPIYTFICGLESNHLRHCIRITYEIGSFDVDVYFMASVLCGCHFFSSPLVVETLPFQELVLEVQNTYDVLQQEGMKRCPPSPPR